MANKRSDNDERSCLGKTLTSKHPLIQTDRLSRDYREAGSGVFALRDISITVNEGEFVALMGPSGSGKSTLLNILGLLDRPTGGHYTFDGRDVSALGVDQRASIRNRAIGFVFQSFNLLPRTTARENVELPLFYSGVATAERKQRATQALQQVGLAKRTGDFPNQLSGGEQQRVAIARALVTDPLLILADEPTGALDSKTGREILGLLTQLKDTRRTLILVTHDTSIAAVAERKIIVLDGQVVTDDGQIARHRESTL